MYFYRVRLLFLSLVFILPGCCQRRIKITRSAFANTERITDGFPEHSSFVILPASKEQKNKLLEKEIGKKISIVLQDNGYSTVKQKKDADYCLFYTYGMKSETRTINELKYVPGQTITTTGSASGTYGRYGNCGYYGEHQQQTQSSGTFVYIPEQYTFYEKFLTCHVCNKTKSTKIPLNKESRDTEVWYGVAVNNDLSGDLRGNLDFLIISLLDLLGSNTQEINSITMYEKDERVASLRSIYLNSDQENMKD
ncbi:MAG TPA: hypothetical protein VGW78_04420 [Candidatus Babeliales bacterium]|jgi:hypothetical protein|nr:hypothetical protein [Candidatus Babeliales bacterium]